MKTLIIPCAGRSSRFPNMKPKFLLTYPDGKLMLEKAIEGIEIEKFDRVIITIVKEQEYEYEAETILKQIYGNNNKFEIVVLDTFTSCQSETVALTIKKANVTGEFWVKDSDNFVRTSIYTCNAIVGLNIEKYKEEINRLESKSFLIINEQGNILDIIEKKIKSQYICIGVYGFENASLFLYAYDVLQKDRKDVGEIYLSHIVSYLIGTKKSIFKYIEADEYEDWGTNEDWRIMQNKRSTYFINFDGVLIENRSRYGKENWDSEFKEIEENIKAVRTIQEKGAQIVVTSTRTEKYRDRIIEFLESKNISIKQLVLECNYSPQIIINDFSPSNHYPSCNAINIPRNGKILEYI